jgi:hypothetical protein
MRIAALIVLSVAAVTAGLVYTGRLTIPPQWNPWAPLDITATPNFLTRYKLERASRDDAMCQQLIAHAELTFTPLEDKVTQPGCGFRNAVRIAATSAKVGEPFALSCRAALSLAMWEHHVMQPAARQHFGAPVTRLEHFGSYSCRTVYNRPNARISHHATADALDVAGFIIGNERVRVLADWDDPGRKGAFLRTVKTGACDFFDSVLSPEYNAAHRDHFHLDRGAFRICR